MFLHAFAVAIVILFALAGVMAVIHGRWNEAVYSFSAAFLNVAVYFRPFH